MADDLLGRIGNLLNRRPWYELPRLLAAGRLMEMRNELREKNLHDTEEPAFATQPIPANLDPTLREGRTTDGSNNDLAVPQMGCGRPAVRPQLPARAHGPGRRQPARAQSAPRQPRADDPRGVPAGDDPEPAGGAWIQFQVHDWFVHKNSKTEFLEIPTAAGDDFGAPTIKVGKTERDPSPTVRPVRRPTPI